MLGGAALSLPVAFVERRPALQVEVIEIDPVVTQLAAEYFAYGVGEYPTIEVIHEDARVYLRRSAKTFDLVYLDVFDHLLTVPWTMVTAEALEDMARSLTPSGIFAANVLSPVGGPGAAFLERFRATLEEVFVASRVYLTDGSADPLATQNLIVIASQNPKALPSVAWPQTRVPAAGGVLTDAWAPVEYLQARVFLRGLRWN